ncbi:unnamed protein product [Clonostachys chloroleuca]|uniref:Uncharacterized protein n=1 Tax=Clonostachys chloroleuca TaxID=1926264 RepID=A0AA35LSG7_9HYPO|nr:unnamed protein product [Clonostachys chloroleuca]
MRFIKTIISLFSFTHLVAARLDGSDSGLTRREMAEAAHEEYLAARVEYIEKRDLFQRAKRAGKGGKCQSSLVGVMECQRLDGKTRKYQPCGPCAPGDPRNTPCLCK